MQFDIYREELPNLGYTHIIVAWASATPRDYWGPKLDTVLAPTGWDAASIYFKRASMVLPMGCMSTMETGVYCVSLKHKQR
jgi:hypothetical protein